MRVQHHYLLLFSWKIVQGLLNQTPTPVIRRYILYFYDTHLTEHLKAEETLLLNELGPNDPVCQKMLFGHENIGHRIESFRNETGLSREGLRSFCNMIIEMVRFEERKMLPHLQQKLSGWRLTRLNYLLAETDKPIRDSFEPSFWQSAEEV